MPEHDLIDELFVAGHPVASRLEARVLTDGFAENAVPPPTILRWLAGDCVSPSELLACLDDAMLINAGADDEARHVARIIVARIADIAVPGKSDVAPGS